MTMIPPLPDLGGLELRDALFVANTEELAMEIAAWLFHYAQGRRNNFPERLIRIIDACDHPTIRGYLIFWPTVSDRTNLRLRYYHREAIARQFGGRGLRWPPRQGTPVT